MILNYDKKENKFYIGKEKKRYKSLIVKIDESDAPGYGADAITEYIYSKVAKSCGIDITNTYLFENDDGYKRFTIERFDIDKNNTRLHTHTLAGLLHLDKSKRLDYLDVMKVVKLHGRIFCFFVLVSLIITGHFKSYPGIIRLKL